MWQEMIVAICVIAAAFFLLRQWLPSKNSSNCGGCGGCNTTKSCAAPDNKIQQ
jgi:hypothetical protein